jgi:hypothetical protein
MIEKGPCRLVRIGRMRTHADGFLLNTVSRARAWENKEMRPHASAAGKDACFLKGFRQAETLQVEIERK